MKKALVPGSGAGMLLGCTAMAEGNLIGYTCMDGTNPFFVTLEGAIREVVEAHGDELISLDPQNSNENQISQIEDLISRGISAIFLNPSIVTASSPASTCSRKRISRSSALIPRSLT